MTAVEWLYQILHEQNYIYEDMSEYLKQAKEMEKQQMFKALIKGADVYEAYDIELEFKEYYNDTFKNTNNDTN